MADKKGKVIKKIKTVENNTVTEYIIIEKENYMAAIIVAVFAFIILISVMTTYEKPDTKKATDDTTKEEYNASDIEKYTTLTSIDDYLKQMKTSDVNVYLIARPTCSYCVEFEPTFIDVIEEYKIKAKYINTDNETSDSINALIKSSDKLAEFGTPTIVVTQNGEVKYISIGLISEEKLIQFLKDSKIINE